MKLIQKTLTIILAVMTNTYADLVEQVETKAILQDLLLIDKKLEFEVISHAKINSFHVEDGMNTSTGYEYYCFQSKACMKSLKKASKILEKSYHNQKWSLESVFERYQIRPVFSKEFLASKNIQLHNVSWSRDQERYSIKVLILKKKESSVYYVFLEDDTADVGSLSAPIFKFNKEGEEVKGVKIKEQNE